MSTAQGSSDGVEAQREQPIIRDWSRFVSFSPQLYFRPQTMDELKGFLLALLRGTYGARALRVLGGLHSCSDVCVSDAILDLTDMPKTLVWSADEALVTVSANWSLHDFLLALSARGKSLAATGGMDHQTLAGLISTNTAPATPQIAMYDLVEWVEYLTVGDDRQSLVEKRVSRTDLAFRATIGSLGALGILTQVQFRPIAEPYYEATMKIVRLKEILADVAQTSRKYDFWRIDWLPATEDGLLWCASRIPEAHPQGDYPQDKSENVLKVVFGALDKVASAGPLLDNRMQVVYAGLAFAYGETRAKGPLRNILPVDRRTPLHVAMAEWSFDPADLDALLQRCREYYHRRGWPNLPIEIELTKTDDYWMSAWNWPGLDYIVKFNFMYLTDVVSTEPERQQILAHLRGLWDYLLQSGIRFKAHWGKINFMDPPFVHAHYGLEHFMPFVRPLFLNKYLIERLGSAS